MRDYLILAIKSSGRLMTYCSFVENKDIVWLDKAKPYFSIYNYNEQYYTVMVTRQRKFGERTLLSDMTDKKSMMI